MIRNHFIIAWRNFTRNRAFSALNIVGLAIGLATCLLISLFVLHELSYDRYNEKANRIVRVVFRGTMNGERMREASVMPPVAQTLQANFPEVLQATRLRIDGSPRITYRDKTFKEKAFAYVDSNFFQVFTLPLLKGNAQTALAQPNTIVITEEIARKYFGNEDPIGKVLSFKDEQASFTVTGVIDKVPLNSHFHLDLFVSMASFPEAITPNWLQSSYYTYLVLPEGYNYQQLEAKLPQIVEKHMWPPLEKMTGGSMQEFRKKGNELGLFLQPLTDIHLYSDLTPQTELEPGGDIRYVYIFGAIAMFMLLLACINFMNLSTAGASKRAKEVGIRKALGSDKSQLVWQFLSESMLLTTLSLLLAMVISWVMLPFFNNISGKELNLDIVFKPWFLPSMLLFGLFVSVLAGTYPAFFLSSFKPLTMLKGSNTVTRAGFGHHSIGLRGGLVVFQFFVSISLIIGTTIVYQQLSYIRNTKLGYDKEQVLVLQGTQVLGKNEEVFRKQLVEDPRIANVSVSAYLPAGPSNNGIISVYPESNNRQFSRMTFYGIDYNYIPTLGMKLISGRNFSPEFPTDSSGVILNETAARMFGWAKNAIGKTITHPALPGTSDQGKTWRVIGVVNDFHFRSLHERIAPLVMILGTNSGSIILKTQTQDMAGLLNSLKNQWSVFGTEEPFQYSFLDERVQTTYESELKTGRILAIFAGLTIFVACLGLFGLATFTAEQRTKEIGVRKVLGASIMSIVTLLSTDFLKPVFISIVIASPLAWYAMRWWLQDFAYRIDIEWWVFVLAGLLVVVIALLTVSFQSIKAALKNPVRSLRSE